MGNICSKRRVAHRSIVAVNLRQIRPELPALVEGVERALKKHDAPGSTHVDAGVQRLRSKRRRPLGEQIDAGRRDELPPIDVESQRAGQGPHIALVSIRPSEVLDDPEPRRPAAIGRVVHIIALAGDDVVDHLLRRLGHVFLP
jgi:hypothetical protein